MAGPRRRHGGVARQRRHRRCSRIRIATGCPPGQLRELTAAFVQEGGAALEASMAGMSPNDADRIASLCRRFKPARLHGFGFPRSGRAVESPRPLA